MCDKVEHIEGHTWHGRKGAVENQFRYAIDYVLLDAEAKPRGPVLFSRNGRNLVSLNDRDHGGAPGQGAGPLWVREVLGEFQLPQPMRIRLMAQPRSLGYVFNPVSFWLCYDQRDALTIVIAEVTNTYGDRHSYICHKPDLSEIGASDCLSARKLMHVSPFQPVEGEYAFRFDIGAERIGIRIDYTREGQQGGVIATLTGTRKPMDNMAILRMMLRRPLGARRVMGLIHWQALKLWWKGAGFRDRPQAPDREASRG